MDNKQQHQQHHSQISHFIRLWWCHREQIAKRIRPMLTSSSMRRMEPMNRRQRRRPATSTIATFTAPQICRFVLTTYILKFYSYEKILIFFQKKTYECFSDSLWHGASQFARGSKFGLEHLSKSNPSAHCLSSSNYTSITFFVVVVVGCWLTLLIF